jgi:hypothetical protein
LNTLVKLKILVFWVSVSTIGLISCNEADPVCPPNQTFDFKLILHKNDTTVMRLKFYNSHDSIDSIGNLPEKVDIPVDLNADSTIFFIDYINDTLPTVTETIQFNYKRNLILHDQECGFIMEFTIDSISATKNKRDSAFIINKLINIDNEGNMEIYY